MKKMTTMTILFFLLPFGIFLSSVAQGITEGDSAELIGTVHHLGVAHLGYPLFALLGKYFTLLIPIGSISYRVNVMCACFMSGLTLLTAWSLHRLFHVSSIVLTGVLLIPCSDLLWEQAIASEVYGLHLFLTVLWLFVLFAGEEMIGRQQRLLLLVFITGLSFGSHHYTIFWIVPFMLYILGQGSNRFHFCNLDGIRLLLFFCLGISLFIYIPIRANLGPAWNWNYASTFDNLVQLLTAQSFRQEVMYSFSITDLSIRLWDYVSQFLDHLGFATLVLAVIGFIILIRSNLSFVLVSCGFLLTDMLYCLFFNEAPLFITPFGLTSQVLLLVISIVGLNHLYCLFVSKTQENIAVLCLVLLLSYLILPNIIDRIFYKEPEETLATDFSFNIANTITEAAVLVCEKDEIFPLLYSQTVEHSFMDVVILHYLTFPVPNQWYLSYITDLYPDFSYLTATESPSLDPMESIYNMSERVNVPVYLTFLPGERIFKPFQISIAGVLYRIGQSGDVSMPDLVPWSFYRLRFHSTSKSLIREKYVLSYHNLGVYYLRQGDPDMTRYYWKKAIEVAPDSLATLNNLALLCQQQGHIGEAIKYYKRVLDVDPDNRPIMQRIELLEGKNLDR